MSQFVSLKKTVISGTSLLWALALIGEGAGPAFAEPASTVESPVLEGKPGEFNPLETPQQRLVEEWEKLGIIPDTIDETPKVPAELSPSMPTPSDNNSLPDQPTSKSDQATLQAEQPTPQGEVSAEDMPAVPQMESLEQPENTSEPVSFGGKGILLQPKLTQVALRFDNDEAPSVPEDPNDPTSEGDRNHGNHKGEPKLLKMNTIPIIRMGENTLNSGGVKVINLWNR